MSKDKIILSEKINKKVLHISHNDLDGAGCVLVSKRIFTNVNYININTGEELERTIDSLLCDTFEINGNTITHKDIFENYDYMLITDFCPSKDLVNELFFLFGKKCYIIDHHTTNKYILSEINERYKSNVIIKEENPNGKKNCGTNLLFSFLKQKFNFELTYADGRFKEYIKAIRYWDTWMWTDDNFTRSLDLSYVFKNKDNIVTFIEEKSKMFDDCVKNEEIPFDFFTYKEKEIIKRESENLKVQMEDLIIIKKYKYVTLKELKETFLIDENNYKKYLDKRSGKYKISIALIYNDYDKQPISALSYFLFNESDLKRTEILMFIDMNNLSISFRGRNKGNIRVDKLAKLNGGGGHIYASGCPSFNSNFFMK